MKYLNTFINEKLIINKDMDNATFPNGEDVIYNIIIAAYLSIKRNKCWVESSTFQKKIKYIEYDDILKILNETFYYDFDKKDIKVKTGYIWKIVKEYLIPIQNLCNYRNVVVNINGTKKDINYKDIDEKYKNILKK